MEKSLKKCKYLYRSWNICSIMEYIPDDKDWKIIELLKKHSDYPTRKIAKQTLLPITTVHNRIRKLKQEGIIKNFTINLDYSKLNKNFVVYLLISIDLQLLKKNKKTQYDIAEELRRFPFVEKTDIVAGGTDIIAVIRVKDVGEYDKVLLKKIQSLEEIKSTQSLIVIHSKD